MAKKYIVREGFIVFLEVVSPKGDKYERTFSGGEEVSLEDDAAALHTHKIEFAMQKDRDIALAAETAARVKAAASGDAGTLVQSQVAALALAQGTAPASTEAPKT